jgi:hypothetical protein
MQMLGSSQDFPCKVFLGKKSRDGYSRYFEMSSMIKIIVNSELQITLYFLEGT